MICFVGEIMLSKVIIDSFHQISINTKDSTMSILAKLLVMVEAAIIFFYSANVMVILNLVDIFAIEMKHRPQRDSISSLFLYNKLPRG